MTELYISRLKSKFQILILKRKKNLSEDSKLNITR
jgi:hypothetical protein